MDERLDDLQVKGYRIYQDPEGFCFGTDAVLLAHFARIRPGERVVDLGTGSGIVPLLMAAHSRGEAFVGLELEHGAVDRARRSVKLNGLSGRIEIVEGDLKEAAALLGRGTFDVVVTNPPYRPLDGGELPAHPARRMARYETHCTLKDVLTAASGLLKYRGRFYMVHRCSRLAEILQEMRAAGLEPKAGRMVQKDAEAAGELVLLEGIKGAASGMEWLPVLFTRSGDGPSEALKRIYRGEDG
ncbi:tRNA1(Val) (adenine(37)-N6)-methyltransferase [Gehongia tenuis]|uniref:tRNA1(Val) (Adenine(37)-N6)-methyltransferase n=1 Tax=Gehongia tenuis TaxID=2763655 RepID=A0A926HP25_9FIRM|nr:tRNA1(Val) (adenine(37)-N6)-methyltransferase [Gehongia tenuis]MBC8530240.1 tRNA1(Val) (adenine(37)-N6)-methyltransferase [Gehongia tenuis]